MMDHGSGLERQIKILSKRSLFTLFLTWLALFFTVVGIAAGYKNFLRVHDKAKEATRNAQVAKDMLPELARKDTVQSWQEQVTAQLKASRQQNQLELTELKNVSNTSAYVADTLNAQVRQLTLRQAVVNAPQKQASQWRLEEARFLLVSAQRKLQLDQDVEAANKALRFADRVLIDLGMPDLLPARQAIAKDLARLAQVKVMNPSVMVSAIDRFAEALKQQMLSQSTVDDDKPLSLFESDDADGRNSFIQRMQASISDVVVVRKYDQQLAKQISGDTQALRFELLRLKLENLKRMGLDNQTNAYQAQLQQLQEILEQEHATWLDDDLVQQLEYISGLLDVSVLPPLQSLSVMDTLLANADDSGAMP